MKLLWLQAEIRLGTQSQRRERFPSMTSLVARKRRWKKIEGYIQVNAGDVRVGNLAHRFKLSASNVSRGLERRCIVLNPNGPRWDTSSNPERKERVEKRRKALALYLLGLSREQIEGLLPIKSETLRGYILALTREVRYSRSQLYRLFNDNALKSLPIELQKHYGLGEHVREVRYPRSQPYRLFNDDALKSLAIELQKRYGLGEHVSDIRDAVVAGWPPGHFSADPALFLRQLGGRGPLSTQFLMRKLRQILRTDVRQHGHFILIRGRRGRLIKLRAPRLDRL